MYSLQGAYPREEKIKIKERRKRKEKMRDPRHNPPGWENRESSTTRWDKYNKHNAVK